MEIIKKSILALILLLVVAIVWVGSSIYFQSTSVDVNPNAKSYTESINESFDIEILEEISQKTSNSFPTSPQEFLTLGEDN